MKKTNTAETKKNVPTEAETNYIEEALKFVESEEMRSHLSKWLTSGSVRRPVEVCADIVFNAPVPLEQKLLALKMLSAYEIHEDADAEWYIPNIQRALDERHKNLDGAEYELTLNNPYHSKDDAFVRFKSFDEATEYIKSLDERAKTIELYDDAIRDGVQCYGKEMFDRIVLSIKVLRRHYVADEESIYSDYIASSFRQRDFVIDNSVILYRLDKIKAYGHVISWFLNEAGEILYFSNILNPGKVDVSTPFAPGDIVVVDCRPSGREQKVLILETPDTLGTDDIYGVTCLFINEHGNIDAGYFKDSPSHVSAIYRAKTYKGELTYPEAPLEIIRDAIISNPKLSREMFNCLNNLNMYAAGGHTYIEGSKAKFKNYGIGWKTFRKGFGLKEVTIKADWIK